MLGMRAVIRCGLVGLCLLITGLVLADRRDQKAADYYTDAVNAIKKKDHKKGIELLLKALERGATEPNEQQGSQTRFLVYQYDPYYWLGVAFMETGDDEKAQLYFDQSEKYGVIKKWSDLYGDLQKRKAAIEGRLAQNLPPPTPTAIRIVIAPPTATPVAVARVDTQPTPVIKAPGPPPTPAPPSYTVGAKDIEEVKKLSSLVGTWGSLAGLTNEQQATLSKKRVRLDELAAAAQAGKAGQDWGQSVLMERAILLDQLRPALRRTLVEKGLTALSRRDWSGMESAAASINTVDPQAHHADLLRFLSAGTRYVLGERRDVALLQTARQAHQGWQQKAGAGKPLPPLVSPALRALIPAS
ncbi:MAG: hypothetical protein IT186_21230 [Acidobacteria bacterium]|nr:hypothetical protein [Acidobacteriota bacterium]